MGSRSRSNLALHVAALAMFVAVGAVAFVAACGSFGGSSDGSGAGSNDAASSDATLSDGGAASPDSGDLFNDDFEHDIVGNTCPGWSIIGCSTMVVTGIAHSGGASCRICNQTSSGPLINRIALAPGSGNYTFQAYVVTNDDGGVPDSGGNATAGAYMNFLDDAGNQTDETSTTQISLTNVWAPVQATTVGSGPASSTTTARLTLFVEPQVDGDCWYIDDVRYYKQ